MSGKKAKKKAAKVLKQKKNYIEFEEVRVSDTGKQIVITPKLASKSTIVK